MPASADHFSEFKPHSKHKHLILEHYISSWGRKLLLRRNAGERVRIVDACAGRGHDDAGNPGSPLIAARVAATATAQLREEFSRAVQIDVIAIEKKPNHFKELRTYLEPFGESVRVLPGTLTDHLAMLEQEGPDVPTFYFIDPFGLEPLQASTVLRALSRPHTEAFLLFAAQAALRHFGAVQTVETQAVRDLRKHEQQSSMFEDLHAKERTHLAAKAKLSQESLEITKERAIEILDAAFSGRHWLEAIERTPPTQRRERFLALYREVLSDAGANRILEIPMLDEDGAHVYFLVHATKSPAGHQLMKESVEYALKRSPLPADVVDVVWRLLRADLAPIMDLLRSRFAGQTVRWTHDEDHTTAPFLKAVVLGETQLYPFQVPELKALLKPMKRSGGGPLVYTFPIS